MAAARADIGGHVFDEPQYRRIQGPKHVDRLACIQKRHVLRRRHNQCTGDLSSLTQGQLHNAQDVIHALRLIYLSDDSFRNAFTEKQIRTTSSRNKRLVRYILFRVESHVTSRDYDFDSARYSIEHVLPENPKDQWPQFSDIQVEQSVYRLGNMSLLQAGHNRDLGNQSFDAKQQIYRSAIRSMVQLVFS